MTAFSTRHPGESRDPLNMRDRAALIARIELRGSRLAGMTEKQVEVALR
jgi:hypothetical protein